MESRGELREVEAMDTDRLVVYLEDLTADIRTTRGNLGGLYDLQTSVFRLLRDRNVPTRKIAAAAGVSDEAVVQRLRYAKDRKAASNGHKKTRSDRPSPPGDSS